MKVPREYVCECGNRVPAALVVIDIGAALALPGIVVCRPCGKQMRGEGTAEPEAQQP